VKILFKTLNSKNAQKQILWCRVIDRLDGVRALFLYLETISKSGTAILA